jgi:uncharacterized protein
MARSGRSRIALAAVLVGSLAACGGESSPSETTAAPGIANPASVFCIEQGGTLEIIDEPGGQVGYCELPDGTRVEEWEYFRAQTDADPEP